MRDIIEYIEYSGITKEQLKAQMDNCCTAAEIACRDTAMFDGYRVDQIAFVWFRNWLQCELKHKLKKPDPAGVQFQDPAQVEAYQTALYNYTYELGPHQFDYTMDTIMDYINRKEYE